MIPNRTSDLLDPAHKATDETDHLIHILGRSAPLVRRVLNEILIHSRRMQEGLRHLGEADHLSDLPSVAEVLTIEQFGYPRTYNLNDGMGPDPHHGTWRPR